MQLEQNLKTIPHQGNYHLSYENLAKDRLETEKPTGCFYCSNPSGCLSGSSSDVLWVALVSFYTVVAAGSCLSGGDNKEQVRHCILPEPVLILLY